MPLVEILGNTLTTGAVRRRLEEVLPGLVAKALNVEENPLGHLEARDVEVVFIAWSQKTPDVLIRVEANLLPERLANLDERRAQIGRELSFIRSEFGLKGGLWVRLCPGSWQDL